MQSNETSKNHLIRLENRASLEMDGIKDVDAFNEQEIYAVSEMGSILIKGTSLHIETLELEMGSLKVTGKIDAIVYTNSSDKKSFLRRAFS